MIVAISADRTRLYLRAPSNDQREMRMQSTLAFSRMSSYPRSCRKQGENLEKRTAKPCLLP